MRVPSTDLTLRVVRQGKRCSGQRVLVAPTMLSNTAAGTLVTEDGREEPIYLVPHAGVPERVVGVPIRLASTLDLLDVEWTLVWGERSLHLASSIALQPCRPMEPDAAEKAVQDHLAELSGRLLLVEPGIPPLVRLGGELYTVVRTDPPAATEGSLLQIAEPTAISLFSSAASAGVDAVILADCSDSMAIDDLTANGAGAARPITRAGAVRDALREFQRVRRRVHGRMSRFAVVGFDEDCRVLFPRRGGMAPLDADEPPERFDEFAAAVNAVEPVHRKSTDIGRALHYAGDLLAQYSRAGNEQLIILLSDGSEHVPPPEAGADDDDEESRGVGDVVRVTRDAVSRMADLRRRTGIRLHALGIGDPVLTQTWYLSQPANWRRKPGHTPCPAWAIPDHRLLRQLVEVGGGDPELCGDAKVFLGYFTRLGAGITRTLQAVPKADWPRASAEELEQLKEASPPAPTPVDPEHARLARRIGELWVILNELALRKPAGCHLFDPSPRSLHTLASRLHRPVGGHPDFLYWLVGVHQVFIETRDPRTRKNSTEPYPVPGAVALLHEDRFWDLNLFRLAFAHDQSVRGRSPAEVKGRAEIRAKIASAMRRRVGRVIDEHETAGWQALHRSVMQDLASTLEELRAVYEAAAGSLQEGTEDPQWLL